MATKQKTVKNRIKAKSATVTLWNQGKRAYQTEPSNVVHGGITEQSSQNMKITTIRAGEKCTVKRAYGEQMAKNYPAEIVILD